MTPNLSHPPLSFSDLPCLICHTSSALSMTYRRGCSIHVHSGEPHITGGQAEVRRRSFLCGRRSFLCDVVKMETQGWRVLIPICWLRRAGKTTQKPNGAFPYILWLLSSHRPFWKNHCLRDTKVHSWVRMGPFPEIHRGRQSAPW